MKNFFVLFLLFIFIPSVSVADMIIGSETVYYVVKGDTFELIGAKLGINWRNIVKENNIDVKKTLKIGQEFRVNTRKIVPKIIDDGIIINIPDRMLYLFKKGKLANAFPVGLGMPSWRGITRWRTPEGKFKVIGKEKNPTWYVPKSIQIEMETKGQPVKTVVPPGTDNPIGRYAVKITIPGILIHETIWPTSVYQFRSHGCIRALPQNMEIFFKEVEINTPGEIIYSPIKVAISNEGKVFLEVHKDIYGKMKDLSVEARGLIEKAGIADKVNWHKVDIILEEKSGIAEDITS
jgi:L,D-transpeptidase ErfK/SrfK